ncbi:uncharacterized protein MONBRDRAFT_29760 [Monosiga brevicollis MX1]|uniref:PIH1 domain-containing protein 1 n=1 Tax=Monosiga brevicollis TaxID=81824 RepID=A9VC18_MONBE|nr:uncharacterized protein MONBRDRAFT_29760 [Monosiga brevicollis MX1]EDQ84947.1 predicted protein [Monosiga brevicollis MX1]|eukprot:XP_001750288.1 hypothetical protein [Monosiga brevicollis MX1]
MDMLRIVDDEPLAATADGSSQGADLSSDLGPEAAEALSSEAFQKLLQEVQASTSSEQQASKDFALVSPEPGFCVKTDMEHGGKVFINVCHSAQVPSPPSVSDEEISMAIANLDNSKFSIPMSAGGEHIEVDNAGKPCSVYDVIINSDVLTQLENRLGMRDFLLELVLSLLEAKHGLSLNREYKLMKRRKNMGSLQPQYCRVKKRKVAEVGRPMKLMEELEAEAEAGSDQPELAGETPRHRLTKEPEENPEFLILEVETPGLLRLHARPNVYFLHLDLPTPVIATEVSAQFNRRTATLTVVMPVAKSNS